MPNSEIVEIFRSDKDNFMLTFTDDGYVYWEANGMTAPVIRMTNDMLQELHDLISTAITWRQREDEDEIPF